MNKINQLFMMAVTIVIVVAFSGCEILTKKGVSAKEKSEQAKKVAALHFGVSIGGQKAQLNNEFCAKIKNPVNNNAEIFVDADTKDIIVITIQPATPEGIATSGKKPSMIIITKGKKSSLDKIDTGKLKPGFYVMNVNVNNIITSVVFEIKK